MVLQEYVEFNRRLGNKVRWLDEVPFCEYRRMFYWSVPRHREYQLTATRLRSLLYRGAMGAIGMTGVESTRLTGILMSDGPGYGLGRIHPKKRSQVRRGLEHCEVRRVPWKDMRALGLPLNREALLRQGRASGVRLGDAAWWAQQCDISAEFSDVCAWGAYVNGELASYVHVIFHDVASTTGDRDRIADVVHFMSGDKHLSSYPNEALIFQVSRELLESGGCRRVCFGSASNVPGLLHWKLQMGYRLQPIGYSIVANPLLKAAKFFSPKLRLWLDGNPRVGRDSQPQDAA